ncbi:MAG: hypothetical protein MRY57_03010, partial [Candidatus Pacebacteria bacterium]|nr:hypothetical protein [Candidatus Paceibacterota bacterium]
YNTSMLYLLHGKSEERKEYIRNLVQELSLVPQHIYDNDIQNTDIEKLVSVQTGLFGDKELYIIHDLARAVDIKKILPEYSESENIFIFSEATVTKPITKNFESNNATIQDFGKEEKIKKQEFNMFSLTDALGARDKKNLWLLFQQAVKKGSPEEIHGILFWQIKNLALVKNSSVNPGMNPFVYKKNLAYAQKFTVEEIHRMSKDFVYMFHNRDTYSTLDIDLEKFILSL